MENLKGIKVFVPTKSELAFICDLPGGTLNYFKATGHLDTTFDNRGTTYIPSEIITVGQDGNKYVSATLQSKEGYLFTKEELHRLLTDTFERGERSCLDKEKYINGLFDEKW